MFGSQPFIMTEREDPGEDTLPTGSLITLQTYGSGSANPGNMSVVRSVAEGYRRTLDFIRSLPER